MADEYHVTRRGPSPVAWLALILASLALIIAWMAYNRSGKDLEDSVSDGVENVQQETQDAADNVQNGTQEAGEAVQEGTDTVEQGLDTGPDGVDDGAQ